MSAYFQMGHDTENLIGEIDLDDFKGIILSPVNRGPNAIKNNINKFNKIGLYDLILDPQLYFPRCDRGMLQHHPYFPSDLDTSYLSSESWWKNTIIKLVQYGTELEINAIASPVIFPKIWDDDYYNFCIISAYLLMQELKGSKIRALTTIMVNLSQLSQPDHALEIASIFSQVDSQGYYLIFISDLPPRREFNDASELFGAMKLIHELKRTNKVIIVSHTSSEMVLFKTAGATHCASGKFFNLRRFTKSRFDEPSEGGGQLSYWFEHSLLSFLRDADLTRLQTNGYGHLIGTEFSNNHWSQEILKILKESPDTAWLALGWRQFLSWYGKAEKALSSDQSYTLTQNWLKAAEQNWSELDDHDILFEEQRNNGNWLRPWRQALADFLRYTKKT